MWSVLYSTQGCTEWTGVHKCVCLLDVSCCVLTCVIVVYVVLPLIKVLYCSHCHSVEYVFVSLYAGVYKVRRSAHGCVCSSVHGVMCDVCVSCRVGVHGCTVQCS